MDRSIAAWTDTLRLDPRNVSVRINRGMAYAEKGDFDRAIADLTEALRLDPRNAQAAVSFTPRCASITPGASLT
jgi:Flp pilus assembly protein TadD